MDSNAPSSARADNHHAPSAFTALALILILDVPAGPGVMC
jgi:hypothetical protein